MIWTRSKDETLLAMWAAGASYDRIAAVLSTTAYQVRRRVDARGLGRSGVTLPPVKWLERPDPLERKP